MYDTLIEDFDNDATRKRLDEQPFDQAAIDTESPREEMDPAQSNDEIKIRLHADGYKDMELTIVPSGDKTFEKKLEDWGITEIRPGQK